MSSERRVEKLKRDELPATGIRFGLSVSDRLVQDELVGSLTGSRKAGLTEVVLKAMRVVAVSNAELRGVFTVARYSPDERSGKNETSRRLIVHAPEEPLSRGLV